MGYRNLRSCVDDLRRHGHLVDLHDEVDAELEAAEIHRRVYASGGPAVYFANVRGCRFPMVGNLFGTMDRARFLFRDTIEQVRRAIELKIDPSRAARRPLRYLRAPLTALAMRRRFVRQGKVDAQRTTISQLPALRSWPRDGGPFVTLPQVYSEDAAEPGWRRSNLGMYRVQLSGNEYRPDQEIGLHYQLHRGIGVHHQAAIARGCPFRVNVFVGGTPAMTVSAVMPLPEGMSELTFAGALAGHRIPMVRGGNGLPYYAEADFVIRGVVDPERRLPEGPFGDHLGYYSLVHPFPVLQVTEVRHREGAIWPFTVVGRPPQEDTTFGRLIHELTGPIIPTVLPGVRDVHAVDDSGVHPLLLAVGTERYTPYRREDRPMELLTQAHAILGQGQMSLAKYLLIVDGTDHPELDSHDIPRFLDHWLARCDWSRDLHFQTRTTIDTLDYSGDALNFGSKVVMAAAGPDRFARATAIDGDPRLPDGFSDPCVCLPGVVAVRGPRSEGREAGARQIRDLATGLPASSSLHRFRIIVIVDDPQFVAANLSNFLWVVFTRSNPAADIDGVDASLEDKHWGCRGPLLIDARIKPHHAWPLEVDPRVAAKVDALAARGGPLARYL